MKIPYFAALSGVGVVGWLSLLGSAGYALAETWNPLTKALGFATYDAVVVVVVGALLNHYYRAQRASEHVVALAPVAPQMPGSPIPSRPAAHGAPTLTSGPHRPRFSVVIPAFNESCLLPAALESLQRQDFKGDYEIIVVDNNSSDETCTVARAHGARVVHEQEQGVCSARQRGTALARGEIVISTDADTIFETSWLSRIDHAFTRDPACVAVAGPCRFVGGPWWAGYTKALFAVVFLVHRLTGHVVYVTATNIAFRKSAWTGYDTRLTQGGDELDLLRRLRQHGKVVFERNNATLTSSRRLNKGLFYNIVVTFLFYYVLGYLLNRVAGRQLLATAPAFRGNFLRGRPRWRQIAIVGGVGLPLLSAIFIPDSLLAVCDALVRMIS